MTQEVYVAGASLVALLEAADPECGDCGRAAAVLRLDPERMWRLPLAPVPQLLHTYTRRARHLDKVGGPVGADVRRLLLALESHTQEEVAALVLEAEGFISSVWLDAQASRVLACVTGRDHRSKQ